MINLTFYRTITWLLVMVLSTILFRCGNDEEVVTPKNKTDLPIADEPTPAPSPPATRNCSSCTYVVPAGQHKVDGKALGIKPGDVIGLNAETKYGNLTFDNIVGTATKPVVIVNCGGAVHINAPDKPYVIRFINSKFMRITGGETPNTYGIKLTGGITIGLNMGYLTSNFEVDHLEISDIGFAGIMAKTDPSCDDASMRENYTMRDVSFHNNYVHDTRGEGLYIGNSFFNGKQTDCGIRLPHTIENLKVYNNIVRNTGWDGIQVGCATKGAEIYGNIVENYATLNVSGQNSGIQINPGTGGTCHSNLVKDGAGPGIVVLGLADNLLYNNIIINPGALGFFCDERTAPGAGYRFINNTIINPKLEGIRIYADEVPMNVVINNIIVNPGSSEKGDKAFVKAIDKVKLDMSNNYFTKDINDLKFVNAHQLNLQLSSSSPVIDKGKDIAKFKIDKDFYLNKRLNLKAYDIGASEY